METNTHKSAIFGFGISSPKAKTNNANVKRYAKPTTVGTVIGTDSLTGISIIRDETTNLTYKGDSFFKAINVKIAYVWNNNTHEYIKIVGNKRTYSNNNAFTCKTGMQVNGYVSNDIFHGVSIVKPKNKPKLNTETNDEDAEFRYEFLE